MLRVKNFRSIQDSGPIELSKLNVLVGPNNAGKSSIIAALLLLKQTLADKDTSIPLVTSGPLVDLGSYLDIAARSPESNPLIIEFRLSPEEVPVLPFSMPTGDGHAEDENRLWDRWKMEFLYDEKVNEVRVASFELTQTGSKRRIAGSIQNGKWSLAGIPKDVLPCLEIGFTHFVPTFSPKGKKPDDQEVVARTISFSMHSHVVANVLEQIFDLLSYVAPVRERIPRYSILGTMPYSEVSPTGQNIMRVLSRRKAIEGGSKVPIKALNTWLEKKFRMLKNVRIKKLDRAGTVRALLADDCEGSRNINLAATGSGISQIVPVVVQTFLTGRKGCLIVEQPEIHLHPAAQTALADLFLEGSERNTQCIVETHSEHLVLRLRRRIAEGRVKPEWVNIIVVEKSGGVTEIRQPKLCSNGHFLDWPEGFFEEGYQEALALAEASQRKTQDAG